MSGKLFFYVKNYANQIKLLYINNLNNKIKRIA